MLKGLNPFWQLRYTCLQQYEYQNAVRVRRGRTPWCCAPDTPFAGRPGLLGVTDSVFVNFVRQFSLWKTQEGVSVAVPENIASLFLLQK